MEYDGDQVKEQMKFPGTCPKELSSVILSARVSIDPTQIIIHGEPLVSVQVRSRRFNN